MTALTTPPPSVSSRGAANQPIPDRDRVDRAIDREGRDGLQLALRGRLLALLAIAVLLVFLTSFPGVLYYHALLAVFAANGLLQGWLERSAYHRSWHEYLFVAFDFALMSFTLIYPNPFAQVEYPAPMTFRFGNFIYFFVLLSGLAFSYRPIVMVWGGLVGAVTWTIGVLWVLNQPSTIIAVPEPFDPDTLAGLLGDLGYVDLGVRYQEVTVFLIVAGLLAAVVLRTRRLVLRQVRSERERGNLARYFPPNIVDRLARTEAPLSQVREQEVAVLFADIVGFTRWSEKRAPSEVIGLLRDVHGRLETLVFDHGGTLDKFIGDGVMATFGTPETSPRDADNALACARAILEAFEAWNAERRARGEEPVRLSLGLHYGAVVVGDIGSERRLEFAVLGDTVNVASRLQELTRSLDCRAAISDAALQAVRAGAPEGEGSALDGLERRGELPIRGREEQVGVWVI
ncbi:MAG: adenylate/guanylate cyclase domain-containing protein [Kiloniellales bacterium]|nr:adenylate/guanylate cyclase domain-containing protein [Kiloniellales bacterium]